MSIKQSKSRTLFLICNSLILTVIVVATLYPLLYVMFASLSNPNQLMAAKGAIWRPQGFSIDAYTAVFKNDMILQGYKNTAIIVFFGVCLNMVLTIIAAFFYSRKNVMHQKFFTMMMVFTMFFSGGLIPIYLIVKGIGLEDTLFALILPGAINATNVIILRTAFYGIPQSLEESAKIDGAGNFRILRSVIVPLALPSIAVVSLYYIVAHWNSWFNASIYIRNRKLFPLQLVLREILIANDTSRMDMDASLADKAMIGETIKYSVIIVATLPVLVVYPFLQKYFVKGVMIGAVKE